MANRGKAEAMMVCLLAASGAALAQNPASAPGSTRASQPPFDIQEYRVLGNSVLGSKDVERAVYPYLGPAKTIADVESARRSLEAAYHDHGFGTVFVDIPEQQVEEGLVRLRVTEGKLRRVEVTGAHYFSGREVRRAVPAATPNTVPNLPTLQREITELNAQTPDRAVVPVLKAGPAPGTVDLALKENDKLPLHGSIELNNQATPDTSSLRALAGLSYDNMFGRLDSLSAQYQLAPQAPGQVGVLATTYSARLNDAGAHLAFLYINSSSDVTTTNVSAAGGSLDVVGKGKVFGTRFIEPLTYTALSTQSFTAGVDWKDFTQVVSGLNTPIKYMNLSLDYSGAWREKWVQWGVDSTVNFGARDLVDREQDFANKRFGASASYLYVRSSGTVGFRLPADFTALLRLGGQYTVDPLVSNEQYTIGGVESARGYLEAEDLGDIGIRATAQLGSPQLTWRAGRVRLDGFVFYDFARASTIDPLPGEPASVELRSVGSGINFTAYDFFTSALTWAYPLVDGPSGTRAHISRILFDVRAAW